MAFAPRPLASSTLSALAVLVLAFTGQLAAASTSFGLCLTEVQACSEDADCSSCLEEWGIDNSSTGCSEGYTVVAASSAGSDSSCVESGTENCCRFGDGMAESCMELDLMVSYWTCMMEYGGCSLEDMPCYAVAATTASTSAEADSTSGGTDSNSDADADADAEASSNGAVDSMVGVVGGAVGTLMATVGLMTVTIF